MIVSSLSSGGLISNYHCSSTCKHCLYNCSPTREKDYVSFDDATRILSKVKSLGCHSVHIGGGEPLLDYQKLIDGALKSAAAIGVEIEYVETNSSWFKSPEQAKEIVRKLMDNGVSTLLVSISPFHNEYIALKKLKGVVAACHSQGMNLFPWISDFYEDIDQFDDSKPHSLSEYAERYGQDYIDALPSRYRLTRKGRALKTFSRLMKPVPLAEILAQSGPCRELDETWHFHVDTHGNYIPGLCTGIAIDVNDLGKELPESDYPFLNALHENGIAALLERAGVSGFKPAKDSYVSKCELCIETRAFLVNRTAIKTKDLNPRQFYDEYQ
jgi:organic radical activating enzyme